MPRIPYLTDEFTFTRDWMRETIAKIFTGGIINRDLGRDIVFVVADACFRYWFSKRFRNEHGIRDRLNPITWPR